EDGKLDIQRPSALRLCSGDQVDPIHLANVRSKSAAKRSGISCSSSLFGIERLGGGDRTGWAFENSKENVAVVALCIRATVRQGKFYQVPRQDRIECADAKSVAKMGRSEHCCGRDYCAG